MTFPFPLFSADAHMSEPADLWSSRLPERFRDRAPAYLREGESEKVWVLDGKKFSMTPEYRRYLREGQPSFVSPVHDGGTPYENIERDDIEGHLRDMDADGVSAETIHPNVGHLLHDIEDPELAMACARIYNDHMADEWQTDRLFPNAIVPVRDVPLAVAEVERAAARGLRGIEIALNPPEDAPYFLAAYDHLWAAARDAGVVVVLHEGSGKLKNIDFVRRADPFTNEPDASRAAEVRRTEVGGFGGMGGDSLLTIPQLVAGGVLDRFPELHFLFVEVGCRWLSTLMASMDDAWSERTGQHAREVLRYFFDRDDRPIQQFLEIDFGRTWPYELKPSEFVQRQLHVTFMDDVVGLLNRDRTGCDVLLWGNDYPHYEGCWPQSRDRIADQIERAHLTVDEARAIFGGNLARLYRIPVPVAH